MSRITAFALVAGMVSAALCAAGANVSDPVHVYVDPGEFYLWHTATGATVHLEWDLPMTAAYADLTVEGGKYSATVPHITAGATDVTFPACTDERTENAYRLTLAFNDGTSVTSVLGVVRGHSVAGSAALPVRCIMPEAGQAWDHARKRPVLPVPTGAEPFAVNGVPVDTGLGGDAGWYAAGPFASCTWAQLALPGYDPANIFIDATGMVFSFR